MDNELGIRLDKFAKDESLMKAFASAASKNDALRILNDNGIGLSQSEFDQALEFALKKQAAGEEIDEGELANVSGGLVYPYPYNNPQLIKFFLQLGQRLGDWLRKLW